MLHQVACMITSMAKRIPKLSDQIRRALKESEMTRYRISKLSGIDQAVLSRFVHGEGGMTVESLDKLAEVLELRLTTNTTRRGTKGK